MTARKGIARPRNSRPIRAERLKDEVYRQMFRLEECRPGAEMGLALALLRAWLAADFTPDRSKEQEWLKKVSPICLQMIEHALQAGGAPPSDVQ